MGYGDHSDLHDHSDSHHRETFVDLSSEAGRTTIVRFIRSGPGSYVGDRDEHKDIAAEISDRFGVLLTPGEVKDIHTSGW